MRLLPFRRAFWIVFLVAFAGALAGQAQPHLVADLNPGPSALRLPSFPSFGIEREGVRFFAATDPQHGYELWRTDGSPAGTYRLADVCPGRCSAWANPLGFFGGFLYFSADDGEHGAELWRTDGTVGGEELFADLCPGVCGSDLYPWIEWQGALWFLTRSPGAAALTFWTSDGTRPGTRPLGDLCGDFGICGLVQYRFFLPDPSGQGILLWISLGDVTHLFRTDGTAAGTVLLHRFQFEATWWQEATAFEPVYFVDGDELWTSDGTPGGTRLVRSLEGLVQSDTVESIQVLDGICHVIFISGEWLRSDGTPEGTVVLAEVFPFSAVVAGLGDDVYAVTADGVWRTAGTPETTVQIPAPPGYVQAVVAGADRLFVLASANDHEIVWTTDGTPRGTHRVNLGAGPEPDPDEMSPFRGGVLISRGSHELWRIDGSGRRAERLHAFSRGNGGSGPLGQIVLDGRLLFFAQSGRRKVRLFASDGTAAGTSVIREAPGYNFFGDYEPPADHTFSRAGRHAFFESRSRIWSTDGTEAGTQVLKRPPVFLNAYVPLGALGDELVFAGHDGSRDCGQRPDVDAGEIEPWVSSGGGPRDTHRILDLNPWEKPFGWHCRTLPESSYPGSGLALGTVVLFAAGDLVHGRELFATDGTKDGTRLVKDINPGLKTNPHFDPQYPPFGPERVGEDSSPSDLVRAGSRAFFVANDGTAGRELWMTNGTRRGTRRVVDLVPGSDGSTPRDLVAVGDAVYFFAAHGAGEGLFRSDGTRSGTVLVSDLTGVSQARNLTLVRDRLFFVALRPESGTELWTSRGTAETTGEVVDLRPGPRGSVPQNLKAVGGRVVFAADDGTSGLEPWSSDGTAAGTIRLGDLASGRDASSPGPFSVVAGQILFGADDGEHGRELWAIPLADGRP
ncbi:MAG TPA: hypothetical protein VGS22_22535 [Thermoanaerobaculia bacterium]|jgi:ELWxxDGT repeat protein|nr:hypothetical protein [Thermoanaerobaculia bacterium]